MTLRSRPTPPIAFDVAPTDVRPRFEADVVAVPDDVVRRLRESCDEVVDDPATLVESSRDWWPLGMAWALDGRVPGRAAVVARPRGTEEVAAVLAVCHGAGVPVTPAGGRSGVCGASVPVHGGVVLDLCAMDGIVDVDSTSLVVDVLPGTFGDVLEGQLRHDHHVTLGHWPQSMALSTVGGWVACRSAGQFSTRYGKVEDMVVGLDVVLADGRVLRTGGAPRAAVGPDLTQVFVGSEGTLGVVTGARLRAHPVPPVEQRSAWAFASFAEGLDACRRIVQRGATPAVLRLYDEREATRNFEVDRTLLLVLDEGDDALVTAVMAVVADECRSAGADALDEGLVERWMGHRNDVSALEGLTRHGIVVDTLEMAGRWSVLAGLYRDVTAQLAGLPHALTASAHQSHAYVDGACLYFTFAGRPPAEEGTAGKEAFYRAAWDTASEAIMASGAALSHHHGVGLNRARFVRTALGPAFDVLVALKQALDPRGILNPGKLGLPSPFGPPVWP